MFLGLCLIFLALPFLVNFLSCFQAPFESWEQPSSWTVFWGQYLSGFSAFAMLYVAWRTLLTTKESNRPYIVIDIVDCGTSHAFLRCRNIGHTTASDITIHIPQSFIDNIKIEEVRQVFAEINSSRKFVLEPNGKVIWDIFCIPTSWLEFKEERVSEAGIKFDFRGSRIDESMWKENEIIFKSNPFEVRVSYNEYDDAFIVDYNNILEDIDPSKRISDQLFSIRWGLSYINESIQRIEKKVNVTEQTK